MPYVVKWIAAGTSATSEHPVRFDVLAEAMDHGCAVLAQEPAELWIEDDAGLCIAEIPRIIEHCAKRRLHAH